MIMKHWFIVFFISILSFSSNAHEYFFGFAELTYNTDESVYEGTLILSTHDLEEWFVSNNLKIGELEDYTKDEDMQQAMSELLFEGFQVTTEFGSLEFQIVGYEVLETGMTNFYFKSKKSEAGTSLDVTFDLMMREYPKQQNKLNYIEGIKSVNAVFLANKKTSTISLK